MTENMTKKMIKKKKNKISFFILLILLLVFITGCNSIGYAGGIFHFNGSARSDNLTNFSVSWGEGYLPTNWSETSITLENNGNVSVNNSKIATINSTIFNASNNHSLRLRVYDDSGRYTDDYVYFQIKQVAINYPETNSYLTENQTINISGRTSHSKFQNYTLCYKLYANSSSPCLTSGINLSNGGMIPGYNGVLANWSLPNNSEIIDDNYEQLKYNLSLIVNLNDSTQEIEWIGVTVVPIDSYEADNNYTQANWIYSNNTPQKHTFHVENDYDYVKFNATENIIYKIETSGLYDTSADTMLYLYDTDGTTQLKYDDDSGSETYASKIVWSGLSNDTYYVKAMSYAGAIGGEYNLNVSQLNISLDIYEPDDNYAQANWILTNNTSQRHRFSVTNDYDYVKFNATENQFYWIQTFNLSDADTVLYLYDTNGTTQLHLDDDDGYEYLASRMVWYVSTNGTYYIKAEDYSGDYGGEYDILVRIVNWSVDAYEPDNNTNSANWISVNSSDPNSTQQHNLVIKGDYDYVKFNAIENHWYRFFTNNLDVSNHTDTVMYLYDTDEVSVIDSNDDCNDVLCENEASMITWHASQNGTYYVRVNQYDLEEGGSYILNSADLTLGNFSCVNITNGTTIVNSVVLCNETFNLDTGIKVIVDNVTIDCNNATLIGPGTSSSYGIKIEDSERIRIKNCNIKGFGKGINIYNSEIGVANDYNIIEDNNITNCKALSTASGIYIYGANYNTIQNNIFINNSRGFEFRGVGNQIHNNTLINNSYGFYLNYVYDDTNITNNNITFSEYDGFYLGYFENNSILNNNVSNNGRYGFQILYGESNNISSNTISNNGNSGVYWLYGEKYHLSYNNISNNAYGIETLFSHNNTINHNNIYNNTNSNIKIRQGKNNTIINNNIYDCVNSGGIEFYWSSYNNTIAFNNIYNNNDGLNIGSGYNNISNNTIFQNTNGIYISTSRNNYTGNNISNNTVGIFFYLGSNNTIKENIIKNNSIYGLNFTYADENYIYANHIYQSNNVYQPNEIHIDVPNIYCVNNISNTYYGFLGPSCAPVITVHSPSTSTPSITTSENQTFNITVYDPDNPSTLTYLWYRNSNLEINKSATNQTNGSNSTENYTYGYNYTEFNYTFIGSAVPAGEYNLTLNISDGYTSTEQNWTLTVTTPAAPAQTSSGGGGGGGGGTLSSAQVSFNFLEKGENKTINVNRATIPISKFSFIPNKDIRKSMRIKITKLFTLPNEIKEIENKEIYAYVEIELVNFEDSDLEKANFNFEVEKSWLETKNLGKNKIALYRYNNNKWTELKAEMINEDNYRIYYSAYSPGLSYFAIGEAEQKAGTEEQEITGNVIAETEEIKKESVAEEESDQTNKDATKSEQDKVNTGPKKAQGILLGISIIIILCGIFAGCFVYLKKIKKRSLPKPKKPKITKKTKVEEKKGEQKSVKKSIESKPYAENIKKLDEFLEQAIPKYHDKDKIEQALVDKGWSKEVIEEEIEKIQEKIAANFINKVDHLIIDAVKQGYDKEKIKEMLIKKGVNKDLVHEEIEKILKKKK